MTRSSQPTVVTWVTAFLDLPPEVHDVSVSFWSAVTGYSPSPARGVEGEFLTLVPPEADPVLRVQRTGTRGAPATGPAVHVDLHVASVSEAADLAVGLGADVVATPDGPGGHVVLRSPGGFVFCFVHERLGRPPAPVRWPGGQTSITDQVCLDIPSDRYEAECAFWSDLTGWPQRPSTDRSEFIHLVRPAGMPIRLLLQRLDDHANVVTAHLDLACDDRAAEVARHETLGATALTDPGGGWSVLRDTTGLRYCITDRRPRPGSRA